MSKSDQFVEARQRLRSEKMYFHPLISEIYSFDKQRIIDICVPKPQKKVGPPQWKQPKIVTQPNGTTFRRKFKKNFR